MKSVMFAAHYVSAVGAIKARMETTQTSYVKVTKCLLGGGEAKN